MELLNDINKAEYLEFFERCSKCNFAQSPEWAGVKTAWHSKAIMVRKDGKVCGTMAILFRKMPGLPYKMAYSSRGPVCEPDDLDTLRALLKDAKALAKNEKAYMLKIDPDIEITNEAFANVLFEEGFTRKPFSKNFEGVQPRFVFRLNIEGKTEDEVFAAFHSKTRYNIRVAMKNNVEVKIEGRDKLADFHRIMIETGVRDDFVTRPLSYFERMYDCLGDHIRLYTAYYEGQPVAGTLAILYGDKVWYLYGASSNSSRNVMPNYLLQWSMIQWAVENKCRIYDFRGVSGDIDETNPLYGLYRFKKGFGGDLTEFIGEFDYVLNKPIWLLYEKGEKFYKKMIKRIYMLKNRK